MTNRKRTIALVGNAIPDRDYSAEIDTCDTVVRINNFGNYSSGLVGKRVDYVFIETQAENLHIFSVENECLKSSLSKCINTF